MGDDSFPESNCTNLAGWTFGRTNVSKYGVKYMGWACNRSAGRERRSRAFCSQEQNQSQTWEVREGRRLSRDPEETGNPSGSDRGWTEERTHSSWAQLTGDLLNKTFSNQVHPAALQFLCWETSCCRLLLCNLVRSSCRNWKYWGLGFGLFWQGRALLL